MNRENFETLDASDQIDALHFLSHNWFRDPNGCDLTVIGGVSIGLPLSRTLWVGFTSISNYFYEFSKSDQTQAEISVASDASRLRIKTAKYLGEINTSNPPTKTLHYDEMYLKESHLPFHRLSPWLRLLQIPLLRIVRRRKVLFIKDWTTNSISQDNRQAVSLFRRSLFSGAFTCLKKKKLAKYQEIFPTNIDNYIDTKKIEDLLIRLNVSLPLKLIELFIEYARQVYLETRSTSVKLYAIWDELLEHYKPAEVYLPCDYFALYISLMDLCKCKSIHTRSFQDGYNLIANFPPLRDTTGRDWLIDEIAAYGGKSQETIEQYKFPKNRIVQVGYPPKNHFMDIQREDKYDVVIMTILPSLISPKTDFTSTKNTLHTAIDVSIKSGYRRIAVKVKLSDEIEYVQDVLNEFDQDITILIGRFDEFVGSANLIIGGISTGIADAFIAQVPYIIFDPLENGYIDKWITEAVVLSKELVARNSAELTDLIQNRTYRTVELDLLD